MTRKYLCLHLASAVWLTQRSSRQLYEDAAVLSTLLSVVLLFWEGSDALCVSKSRSFHLITHCWYCADIGKSEVGWLFCIWFNLSTLVYNWQYFVVCLAVFPAVISSDCASLQLIYSFNIYNEMANEQIYILCNFHIAFSLRILKLIIYFHFSKSKLTANMVAKKRVNSRLLC